MKMRKVAAGRSGHLTHLGLVVTVERSPNWESMDSNSVHVERWENDAT